jgi:hypothetical protein
VKLNPMLDLPSLQKSSSLRREPPSTLVRSFESQFRCKPAGFRNQPVIRRQIPCTRSTNQRSLTLASPSAYFDLSNRSHSTFVGYNRPLVS